MSTGLQATAERLQAETPEALQQEQPEGLISKVADMLDMDDPALRTLDGFLNTGLFMGVMGAGLETLAHAGDVISVGNGGDLLAGLNETMLDTFGAAPETAAEFGPDGEPVAAPAATPENTPGNEMTAAAPGAAPGMDMGMAPSGPTGPGG